MGALVGVVGCITCLCGLVRITACLLARPPFGLCALPANISALLLLVFVVLCGTSFCDASG